VLQKIVAFAVRAPYMVFMATLVLVGIGVAAYAHLDVEAYPNPVPPLVEVLAQPPGWSAEETERYVTVPLEMSLAGMPNLEHVRSQSVFGLSDVKCYFAWGTSYEGARQEVLNRLHLANLPDGVSPDISPWNAIGEVFRYTLVGDGYELRDLKTAEDWVLERQFKTVPGIIDVVSFGGFTKQYHVNVDPYRLRGQGVQLPQVEAAIAAANVNVGGQRLQLGEQSLDIRALGLINEVRDIDDIVVASRGGTPIRVRDVGQASIGSAVRLGIVGKDDDDDVVQGTVLMRYGGRTGPTLTQLHKKLHDIDEQRLLPPGVQIKPYYDRERLVEVTTHTVNENLLVGMVLVTAILLVFLGNGRAAVITAMNIPLALLIAFCGMVVTGTPANLISLGAVDFGIVVDSSVIMMENIFRHLGHGGKGSTATRVLASVKEVAGPMLFSTSVIAVAFLPLFTISGVAGVIFSPLASTYAFSIGGAFVLALTLTPALASKVMPAEAEEREGRVMTFVQALYARPVRFAARKPLMTMGAAVAVMVLGLAAYPFLGGEFMPKLEEGNFWIRATLPTGISLDKSREMADGMRRVLRGCTEDKTIPCDGAHQKVPEITTVISQTGRPDDGTDIASFSNIELLAPLEPKEKWRRGVTKASLTADLQQALQGAFPGVNFNFSQAISDNVEEALSGVKGENSIKVTGPDIRANESTADKIYGILRAVPGVEDLGLLRSLGQPAVKIVVDRQACSRYGINTGDVEAIIEAAIGGKTITHVYEGERQFDLVVRFLEPYRNSIRALNEVPIPSSDGSQQVPLGQLASISTEDGASLIYREDGQRYTPIKFSVRGRDLKSTILDAQARIKKAIKLPYDMRLQWAGQLSQMNDAIARLLWTVPITLLLIGILVFAAVRNWIDALVVFLSIPLACAGGVIALAATRTTFSISAAMGFISIFGIAIQDAILVVSYFQALRRNGRPLAEAAHEAAEKRFRPSLMTTLVATLGLLPAALSTGIGSETQKPLAIVVIGGSLIVALTSRITKPAMLVVLHAQFGIDAGVDEDQAAEREAQRSSVTPMPQG
jgi:heavy metal efflux system protein